MLDGNPLGVLRLITLQSNSGGTGTTRSREYWTGRGAQLILPLYNYFMYFVKPLWKYSNKKIGCVKSPARIILDDGSGWLVGSLFRHLFFYPPSRAFDHFHLTAFHRCSFIVAIRKSSSISSGRARKDV